jgi:hypothetical protein
MEAQGDAAPQLFSAPLGAIDVYLRRVEDVSTFTMSLVVKDAGLDAPATHRAAGAVLPGPLTGATYVVCLPLGATARRVRDVGVESHAFESRFSTVTNDPRAAQAILNPRALEWLLALPDDVAIVCFQNFVIAVALTQIGSYALASMESTAVAVAVLAPEGVREDGAATKRDRPSTPLSTSSDDGTPVRGRTPDPRQGAVPGVTILPRRQ